MGRGRIIQLNAPFNAENYRRVVRGYRPCVKMDINEEEKHRKLSLDPILTSSTSVKKSISWRRKSRDKKGRENEKHM